MNSSVAIGLLLYFVTHIIIWFQVNGQFVWPWAKEHPALMALIGFPISYILIIATKYVVGKEKKKLTQHDVPQLIRKKAVG